MHNSEVISNNLLRNIKLCAKNELSYVYYDVRSKLSGDSGQLDEKKQRICHRKLLAKR